MPNTDTKFYKITNEGDVAHVYIYGVIGTSPWDDSMIGAADFAKELKELEPKPVHLHINSPGGDVMDGIAIHNAIKNYAGSIDGFIEGLAASSASFIAIACDTLSIADNAFFMIHKAWSWLIGNADEARNFAEQLDMHDANIADMYARKAGGQRPEWLDLMSAEKWYRGSEAVDAGLCDEVIDGLQVAACIDSGMVKAMALKHVPEDVEIVDCYTGPTIPTETKAQDEADSVVATLEAVSTIEEARTRFVAFSSGIYQFKERN